MPSPSHYIGEWAWKGIYISAALMLLICGGGLLLEAWGII